MSWCFLFFLLSLFQPCFLFSPCPSPSPPLCLHDERSALLQLKQKHYRVSPYYNYLHLNSWKPNTDCCFWEGITCDGTTGHVIGLDLSNSSLYGSIHSNSSFFHLHHLQMLNISGNGFNYFAPSGFDKLSRLIHLNLSHNLFSGRIPSQISQLTNLVSLDLSWNQFGGQISSEFSNLSKLVFLDLSFNYVAQLEIPNLRAFVENLFSLRELHLDWVKLSAKNNQNWCRHLSSALPNLQVLSMRDCLLTGPLDASITSLCFLSELYLDFNSNLSSTVPSSLINLTSLTAFSLRDCGFHGDFPINIFLQPNLKYIDISGNPLLAGHLPEFPQVNSTTLQLMDVCDTKFQGKLPSTIGNLKFLKGLYLSGLNISGPIPPSLANLTHLTALDLSINSFNGQIPSFFRGSFPDLGELWLGDNLLQGPIHSYLFFLPSMWMLDLSKNKFSGLINDEPTHNISFSGPLRFDLSGNKLKGQDLLRSISKIKGIIESLDLSSNDFSYLGDDRNLSYDSLSNNRSGFNFVNPQIQQLSMRSCNISKIPDFFLRNQKELTFLDISYNRIRKFPGFLKNLKALSSLDISSNRIDGAIPKWIWQKNLGLLNLSDNFTGLELPLSNHSFNIEVLDLHSNMIQERLSTGTFNQSNSELVSPILRNLTFLLSGASFFSISDNKLTGKIPSSICNASNLEILDLSNNQLSGTIPTCLSGASLFFSISDNKLIGKFPLSICNASNLEILDLSNNQLSGTIPTCLDSNNLRVLNLESNNLHGTIPPTFKNGCNLHTLKLNGNMLQGEVPRSLVNCKKLTVVDIADNQFNDTFPYWLENLSDLQVLVMRSNKFGGPIAQLPQSESPFQSLHVIDLSFNNFTGNLPLQYICHWKAMMFDENTSELDYHSTYDTYFRDRVAIVEKGLYLEMQKILTTFTTMDLSNNNFEGEIPYSLGILKALKVLNLSRNSLTGQIPFSLGNLSELESLDLSRNKLSGEIPRQLISLTFLAVLNLSYNNFIGSIPQGNQFDTFSNTSYEGNVGLCGLPLSRKCEVTNRALPPTSTFQQEDDSTCLFALVGYCSGLIIGLVIGQQLFWRRNKCSKFISSVAVSKQRKGSRKIKHHNRGR